MSGRVTIDTHGSNFNTLLAVYTGTSVSALKTVASDDDTSYYDLTSQVSFNAVAGTTYHVAVDGYRGASGNIVLNLSQATPPANDNFANALTLTGNTGYWMGTNVGATREAGEPVLAGNSGGASVWFNWTAPVTRLVTLTTEGSNFDTMLGVYTGSSLSGLTLVAGDDDVSRFDLTSAVQFNAVAGVTYRIAVDGYNGASGTIELNFS